jgi:SsrA-binding protein
LEKERDSMKIINKKATFDYQILDRFEAGIALLGCEVKSLRGGHAKLEGGFVRIIGGEAFLVNAEIYTYQFARPEHYDAKRTRKLLIHKKEILSFLHKTQGEHLTLIPLSLYTKGPIIKLEIGIGKGKKEYDKRESIKKKDLRRELERGFRGKVK